MSTRNQVADKLVRGVRNARQSTRKRSSSGRQTQPPSKAAAGAASRPDTPRPGQPRFGHPGRVWPD